MRSGRSDHLSRSTTGSRAWGASSADDVEGDLSGRSGRCGEGGAKPAVDAATADGCNVQATITAVQCFWPGEWQPLNQCAAVREEPLGCGVGERAAAAYEGAVLREMWLSPEDFPNGSWATATVSKLEGGGWDA